VYDCLLAMISLKLNGILDLPAQFYGSTLIAILLLIFYACYMVVWVRPYRLFELYKIHNAVRVVGLAILPINRYAGIIIIDIAELAFFVLDVKYYRFEKLNLKAYVLEKVLTIIVLNSAVFANSYMVLLVLAGICIAGIFFIKIYYSGATVKEYLDKKKEEAADAVEIPD
jgi:hypothetical protein